MCPFYYTLYGLDSLNYLNLGIMLVVVRHTFRIPIDGDPLKRTDIAKIPLLGSSPRGGAKKKLSH